MLVFEHEIIVLNTSLRREEHLYDEMQEYALTLNTVTYATLNHNEKLLGVATVTAASPEVTLFNAEDGF